ncbi:zinc finger BED domain-containing protein 4-like [Myxocyprinus asiaticus]|uniref:zinc finger BED domain-containing protein 4-like n=1 Tax=Myxocyprinus asiaticus TaxID=70543 RepID=UPI002223A2CE|nr:zinc finger BED domain-containing protein 4-like [Myxocyprinus asiaticus]
MRDNAPNMSKAMQDAQLPSLPCMAHMLQLVVNEGLLSQRSISDIVAYWKKNSWPHSPLACSRLQNVQTQLGQSKKSRQQDVPTRWNSTYYMLLSLTEQEHALGVYAADYKLPATLTSYQWGLIENISTLLAPFEELTKEISFSTATAADVIRSIVALKRLLRKSAETDHGMKMFKTTLLEAVEKRFSDTELEPMYCLATILDPRYKDRYFSKTQSNIKYEKCFRMCYKQRQENRGQRWDTLMTGAKRKAQTRQQRKYYAEQAHCSR